MSITLNFKFTGNPEEMQKIQIIKRIRFLTGFNLKDSKTIADTLQNDTEAKADVLESLDFRSSEVKESIRLLKAFEVEVNVDMITHSKQEIRSKVEDCLHLCVDVSEPEVLEVLAVAFKMIQDW